MNIDESPRSEAIPPRDLAESTYETVAPPPTRGAAGCAPPTTTTTYLSIKAPQPEAYLEQGGAIFNPLMSNLANSLSLNRTSKYLPYRVMFTRMFCAPREKGVGVVKKMTRFGWNRKGNIVFVFGHFI